MIDLINESVTTDFACIYQKSIGGGIGSTSSGLVNLIRDAYKTQNENLVSQVAARKDALSLPAKTFNGRTLRFGYLSPQPTA